ncbi:hypothetical protein Pmani_015713 [Petrolisthes manimaculis]|uniref:Uncharacterized protein n=1 Tax=Petrolisthes manimaculis TaxID=1843537 RepID=A0AAE1U747_9EUCA|nr:hypothetical protein Pmani_015713 [Petrolisthes manimaculis]
MFTKLNQTSVRVLAPPVVISDISIYNDFDCMCTEAHIAAPNIRQDLQVKDSKLRATVDYRCRINAVSAVPYCDA